VVDLRYDKLIKSFLGVQGAIFQKSPLVAEGIKSTVLGLLDVALDQFYLGRAGLLSALEKTPSPSAAQKQRDRLSRAMNLLDQAVEGLRKYGDQNYLVTALIKRAAGFSLLEEYAKARDDLSEALDIAELGSMKLHLCDYHLEAGRLCRAQDNDTEAAEHFQTAKKLIEETGYHRRDSEI